MRGSESRLLFDFQGGEGELHVCRVFPVTQDGVALAVCVCVCVCVCVVRTGGKRLPHPSPHTCK